MNRRKYASKTKSRGRQANVTIEQNGKIVYILDGDLCKVMREMQTIMKK